MTSRVLQEERAALGTQVAEVRRGLTDLRAALLTVDAALRPLGEQSDPAQVAAALTAAQGLYDAAVRVNIDATNGLHHVGVIGALHRAALEAAEGRGKEG